MDENKEPLKVACLDGCMTTHKKILDQVHFSIGNEFEDAAFDVCPWIVLAVDKYRHAINIICFNRLCLPIEQAVKEELYGNNDVEIG